MKERILAQAQKMFITYGYHSVTMDHIAKELCISKKTLYENYSSKNRLIEEVVLRICDSIEEKMEQSKQDEEKNAIEQLFESIDLVGEIFNKKTRKPQWELRKYHPKIYEKVESHWETIVKKYMYQNLQKGIAQGLYRQEIDIRFFFRFFMAAKDSEISEKFYPEREFSVKEIEVNHIEYIMRILVTPKGLAILEKKLQKIKTNL